MTRKYLTPEEAFGRGFFEPEKLAPDDTWSELERKLVDDGFVRIPNLANLGDIEAFIELFEGITSEGAPEYFNDLETTIDGIDGHWAGYRRRERKIDKATGRQIADAKHLFHIHKSEINNWREGQLSDNLEFQEMIEVGVSVLDDSMKMMKDALAELEETHHGIMRLHFEGDATPAAFLRIVTYDGYDSASIAHGENLVAGRHSDRGNFTIQIYASADGFYIQSPPKSKEMVAPERNVDEALFFTSLGLKKLYKPAGRTRLPASEHEVRRVISDDEFVPPRTAVIAFLDPSFIDLAITPEEAHLLSQHD